MKVIAFYLPQFHAFPENDLWWGKGFTEWTNTKKAVPLFRNHNQPREPLNDFFYDLTDENVMLWQVKLAQKYGVYGFCFYHYWFDDDHILMQKPLEKYLSNQQLDLPFCISWANETWSRRWDGSNNEILIEQTYGDEDTWEKHFYYLLPYFKDKRYINYNGKPLFILYKPEIFDDYKKMFEIWDLLAQKNGLKGISFGVQGAIWNNIKDVDDSKVDLRIMYEPGYTGCMSKRRKGLKIGLTSKLLKVKTIASKTRINFQSYDAYCQNMVRRKVVSPKMVPGMFVDWDNTARKAMNSTIFLGSTPKKFKNYFKKMIIKAKKDYKKDMIFINAWNEWAEGCYLEPDKKNEYGYLQAIKDVLDELGE